MKKYNYIASAKRTFKIESDAIKSLATQLDKNFSLLCEEIIVNEGKFVIMGVGKSGHIGQKNICNTFQYWYWIFFHPSD
jgi:arabinose-5-phosphate isomerase